MIWLMLLIVLAIIFVGSLILFWDDSDVWFVWLFGVIVALVLNGMMLICAYNDWQKLYSNKEAITVMENNISTIRESYYVDSTKVNSLFVKGSIENVEQSKTLSEYVSRVIRAKSEYNMLLKDYQLNLNSKLIYWFGYGVYLSELDSSLVLYAK